MRIATHTRLKHNRRVIPARAIRLRQRNARITSRAAAGFSLVELIIVAAILFILSTLYLGNGARGYQSRKMVECGKNLQNIYVALKTYALDNHDRLPILADAATSEPVLSQLIPRYTTGTEFFICPGSKDAALPDATPFAGRRISYAYYMGRTVNDGATQPLLSDRQVNTNGKSSGQLLFSSNGKKPGNNHNKYGGNIQFCDGSVQTSPPASAFDLTNAPGVTLLNPKP